MNKSSDRDIVQDKDVGQPMHQGPQDVPAKKSYLPLMIRVIAVVAVIAFLLIWTMPGSESPLVDRWNGDYAEFGGFGIDYRELDGWIEFRSDGTGTNFDKGEYDEFEWEDLGDGRVELSLGVDQTMIYDYTIDGDTLTMEYSQQDMSIKSVYQRA